GQLRMGIVPGAIDGAVEEVEAPVDQLVDLASPRLETGTSPTGPMVLQGLVERRQGPEPGPQSRPRRRPFGRRGPPEPRGDVPEPAPLLLQRPAIEGTQGDRDESQAQATGLDEPLMDPLQRRAVRTVAGPGTRHQPSLP